MHFLFVSVEDDDERKRGGFSHLKLDLHSHTTPYTHTMLHIAITTNPHTATHNNPNPYRKLQILNAETTQACIQL